MPHDRVALITGGASGIGAATAERLGRDGTRLVLAGIDAEGLEEAAAHLGGPDRALDVVTDVRSFAECERAVAAAVDAFGRLDILVNTFGGGDPDKYLADLLAAYPQKMPRFIRPDEVAELIAYLCSERAAAITGAAISIDFGLTAGY